MIKIFAKIGSSDFIQYETKKIEKPLGYIEMKGERPTPLHIANTDGEWVLPEPQPEVPENETDTENAS